MDILVRYVFKHRYKYALVSLNGEGVANGFHDSLQELQDHPYIESMVLYKDWR
ncbi:hypothetical protein QUF57_13330 [Bacillus pumilus]|uniref:hypothetical protein n=1 Tax=Bacillus pumilus TaxID=1408 RepID=UPI0025A19998|nr:hypothetical protein [Bacillus pumilus]MDM5320956.1 hypothetical protein [Bacillus pumilus]